MAYVDVIMTWLHLVAGFTWVGGLIFVNLVLTPAVQPKGIPPQFIRLMGMERFRWFAWGSIAILVLTGVYNTAQHVPSPAVLLGTPYGLTLLVKIIVAAVMILITAVNSLVIRGRMIQAAPGPGGPSPEMQAMGRRLVILSRVNLALGLLVLLLVAILRVAPTF